MILQLIIKTLEGDQKKNIFNNSEGSLSDYLISLQSIFFFIGGIQLFNVLTYSNKSVEAGDLAVLPERCSEERYALKCVCLSTHPCVWGGLFVSDHLVSLM